MGHNVPTNVQGSYITFLFELCFNKHFFSKMRPNFQRQYTNDMKIFDRKTPSTFVYFVFIIAAI